MISLASRKDTSERNLPNSVGTMKDLYKLAGSDDPDRSLEEGEILEETPPSGVERFTTYQRYNRETSRDHEPRPIQKPKITSANGHETSRESSQHAAAASHQTRALSTATSEQYSARSYTPSPSSGAERLLPTSDRLSEDSNSRYTHQRTPYRGVATSGGLSTAASSIEDQRRSSVDGESAVDSYVDDTSRTPRRTPFHRRYDSELLSTRDYQPSRRVQRTGAADSRLRPHVDDRARTTLSSLSSSRSHSSLANRRDREDDAPDGNERNEVQLAKGSRGNHAYYTNDRKERRPTESTGSTRSYTPSSMQRTTLPSSRRSKSPDPSYPNTSASERPSSRLSTGRATPRRHDQSRYSLGQGSFELTSSRSVRSLGTRYEHSNDGSAVIAARPRTLSDREGREPGHVREERQTDGRCKIITM